MKSIRLTLVAFTIFSVFSFISCSKNSSPVTEYAQIFETAASELSEADSNEEATKIIADGTQKWQEQAAEIMKSNADYRLTPEDKQLLRDVMKRYMETTMKKSLEISQQPTDGIQEMATSILEATVYPAIDQAETLGDLASSVKK